MSGPGAADAELVEAFRLLAPQARRLAYCVLGDPWAAEDVAAEALARAYARWPKVGALPWRDAWVLRVAANLAIDAARRRPRAPAIETVDDSEDASVLRLALVAALRALPRRQRETIALRYLAGLSEADVARALGVAPGTVKSHLHRGLAAMRRSLGDELKEENLLAWNQP